jgi:hypothetical protein
VAGALFKRGCIIQISRMSPPSLPRPDTSPMRASNTSSMASCSAGNGCALRARRCCQPASTSCHSTQASKTRRHRLALATRRSVSSSAALTKGCSARSTTTSSSG